MFALRLRNRVVVLGSLATAAAVTLIGCQQLTAQPSIPSSAASPAFQQLELRKTTFQNAALQTQAPLFTAAAIQNGQFEDRYAPPAPKPAPAPPAQPHAITEV